LPSRYYKNTRSVLKIIESDEFSKNYFINVRRETDINKKKKTICCEHIFLNSVHVAKYLLFHFTYGRIHQRQSTLTVG
jgi:hypothetical protein